MGLEAMQLVGDVLTAGGPCALLHENSALPPLRDVASCTLLSLIPSQGDTFEHPKSPTLLSLPVPAMPSKEMFRMATATGPGGHGYGFCDFGQYDPSMRIGLVTLVILMSAAGRRESESERERAREREKERAHKATRTAR